MRRSGAALWSILRDAKLCFAPQDEGGNSRGARRARGHALVAPGLLAILVALLPVPAAIADDSAPMVSPDRIEDAPSIKPDPYPDFDNFAWRAFIALNWPSLTDPAHRGEPDRAKTLGDPGPRVWETFKARYELFQVGPDGRPIAPKPWATYEAANPCGADVDDRAKTLATFTPFMDFNQSAFLPGIGANPLVAQNRTYTRYEGRLNEPEYSALAVHGWSSGPEPARSGSPCGLARRLDRGQGRMASSQCGGHAGGESALLRGRERQRRRRRQDARRWARRLFEKRRRAGRPAHRDPDEGPAARAVGHVRACRQRAPGWRGRGARARRQGRGRALFLFRRFEAQARPLADVRLARHFAGQHRSSAQARPDAHAGGPPPSDPWPQPWR